MMWIPNIRKTSIFGWVNSILFVTEGVCIYLWNVRKGGCTTLRKPSWPWVSGCSRQGLRPWDFCQIDSYLVRLMSWGHRVDSLLYWRLVSGLAKFYLLSHVLHEHGCRFDGLVALSLRTEWISLWSCFLIFWKWKLIIFANIVHSFFFQNSFTKSEYFILPDLKAPKLMYRRNLICVSKCLILDKSWAQSYLSLSLPLSSSLWPFLLF